MNDQPRRTGRSVWAVVAGFLTVFIVTTLVDIVLHATGVYPPWNQRMADPLFLLATAYRLLITIGGGWVTARLAPNRPVRHAVILGIVGTVVAIIAVAATWNRPDLGPKWYPIALVVTALPCSWLGGVLAAKRT